MRYSEPCHNQNAGIFRAQDVFITLSRHIPAYSERCVTFAYWELFHIEIFAIFKNFGICRTQGILKILVLGTFRHIQTYSIMIVIITLTFFHLKLTYFSTNFKKTPFLTTMTSTSMLDWVFLTNTRSFKIAL